VVLLDRSVRTVHRRRGHHPLARTAVEHSFDVFPRVRDLFGRLAVEAHVAAPAVEVGGVRLNVLYKNDGISYFSFRHSYGQDHTL
jgi:hypothetical protein